MKGNDTKLCPDCWHIKPVATEGMIFRCSNCGFIEETNEAERDIKYRKLLDETNS